MPSEGSHQLVSSGCQFNAGFSLDDQSTFGENFDAFGDYFSSHKLMPELSKIDGFTGSLAELKYRIEDISGLPG